MLTSPAHAFSRRLNLMVFHIAANHPLHEIPLDLGTYADLGKLYMSSCYCPDHRFRVHMYLDLHPMHSKITITGREHQSPEMNHETVKNAPKRAIDRLQLFVREHFDAHAERNALTIGGHGQPNGTYFPIDNYGDQFHIAQLASMLESELKTPLTFLALDACQLAQETCVFSLRNLTQYLLAYQDDTPWNGCISPVLVGALTTLPMRDALERIVTQYCIDCKGQEEPSGISVFDPKPIEELQKALESIGLRNDPNRVIAIDEKGQDLLDECEKMNAALEKENKPKAELSLVRSLLGKVIVLHRRPPNAIQNGPKCGLNTYRQYKPAVNQK